MFNIISNRPFNQSVDLTANIKSEATSHNSPSLYKSQHNPELVSCNTYPPHTNTQREREEKSKRDKMVSWLMTLKAVLISSGVASVGVLLKVYVPMAVDFSVSQAPVLWSSLLSWLKPPYLYVLTNGIIITIVASSKYYRNSSHHGQEGDESASPRMLEVKDLNPDAQFSFVAAYPPSPKLEPEAFMAVVYDDHEEETEEEEIIDAVAMMEDESELKSVIMVENFDLVGSGGDEDAMLASANSNRMTESENLPPKDSRFGHRESVKASTKGMILI